MPGQRSIGLMARGLALAALVYAGAAASAGEIENRLEGSPPSLFALQGGALDRIPGPTHSAPLPDQSTRLLREPPTITGEIHVGDHTLIPYLGAGFGGGYATERDRMLGQDPTLQQKHILGNMNGGGYLPNEFQMGFRIPSSPLLSRQSTGVNRQTIRKRQRSQSLDVLTMDDRRLTNDDHLHAASRPPRLEFPLLIG